MASVQIPGFPSASILIFKFQGFPGFSRAVRTLTNYVLKAQKQTCTKTTNYQPTTKNVKLKEKGKLIVIYFNSLLNHNKPFLDNSLTGLLRGSCTATVYNHNLTTYLTKYPN